jgi:hypothetical protein
MKRNTGIILFLGLMATTAVGILYINTSDQNFHGQQAKASPESSGQHPAMATKTLPVAQSDPKNISQADLAATIAELRKEISSIKSQVVSSKTPQVIPNPEPKDRLNDIDQQLKEQKELEREILLKVGQHFTEQQVDSSWSTEAETRIESALSANKEKVLNVDYVECRSSICKLEIEDMDSKAMDTFRNDFREQTTDVFSAGIVGEDEYGKTIIYMSKNAEDIYEN